MDDSPLLTRRVRQVERRLLVGRVLTAWPSTAAICFGLAALLIAVDKYAPLGVRSTTLLWSAAGLSLVAALGWARLRRGDSVLAAAEIDRRCGLAERVSSAVALGAATDDETAVAAAVRSDAERALAKVDVAASFPVRPAARTAWPLVVVPAALLIALRLTPSGPLVEPPPAQAATATVNVRESVQSLEKKLTERMRTAEQLKLAEAQKLLEKLQEEARRLKDDRRVDPTEALVKLNDLARQLEDRRQAVERSESLKRQLSRLRLKAAGPAEKLARSLSQGDYRDAAEQLRRLREELKSDKLDAAQKEQLQKQLDELEQQLDELAKQQEQRRQDAEQKLAQGLKSKRDKEQGAPQPTAPSADELAELSRQLAEATADQEQLKRLERALKQAAEGAEDGRSADLQQALHDLQNQLNDLAQQDAERELLDEGLQDLAECKAGCRQGGEPGDKNGSGSDGADGEPNGKLALKPGQGRAQRPGGSKPGVGTAENENETTPDEKNLYDTQVRPQVGNGPLRVVGPTDGPNAKGRALEAIREQARALADGADPQPVANQPLDRSRRAQKRQYFDALRQAD